jgi:citrate synthase
MTTQAEAGLSAGNAAHRGTSRTIEIKEGLKGVVVARSDICQIDGHAGTLSYRGIDVGEMAQHATYEETAYLLWHGALPTRAQLAAFTAELAAERPIEDAVWQILTLISGHARPMDAMRTAVSALACCDTRKGALDPEANRRKAMQLTAKLPTVVAHYHRILEGQDRVHPDPDLGHAENFLMMLHGQCPSALEARAMDMAMVLMAEHGFNASTFAARVTSSTLSDMCSAITTAIGTLRGPLHGGANERAMQMLLEIGDVDNVEAYIDGALAAKRRIMGFGHRVYRTSGDPRSAYLKDMLYEVCEQAGNVHLFNLASAVAETVWERKRLFPNVDFYAAPLLYLLGIPIDLFTPIFAISRIVGWTTQVMEQYAHNRLMRPLCAYTGPVDRPYTPIERREAVKSAAPAGGR